MAKSIINADTDGLKQTGGDTAELELQVNGTTAITINSAGYWVLANALPITSGGTGSTTATFSGENITSLNASNISSGTLAVAQGGTGSNTGTFSGANITSLNASSISSGTIANARTTASSSNGASTIVQRDASGNFSTNVITANSYSGSGANLTSLNASSITSGTLAIANGGTGSNTATFSGANITSLNASSVSSGTLAIANGGTGSNTATFSGANITSLNASSVSSGTLGVANGGTGAATLTANNVILGNGTSAVQFVAPGTNGNVLTSNGTTWTSAAAGGGGGSFVFLGSGTAATSVVDFNSLDTSTYNSFEIVFEDVRASLGCRFFVSSTIVATSNYQWQQWTSSFEGASYPTVITNTSVTAIQLGTAAASAVANVGWSGRLRLIPAGGYSILICDAYCVFNTGVNLSDQNIRTVARLNNATAANGIRFGTNTVGNLVTGTFRVYGIKSS
jgi:hypothetical protein